MMHPARQALIDAGILKPAELVPDRAGEGRPFLPLDGEGAREARKAMRRGEGRIRDMNPLDFMKPPTR